VPIAKALSKKPGELSLQEEMDLADQLMAELDVKLNKNTSKAAPKKGRGPSFGRPPAINRARSNARTNPSSPTR